MELFHFLRAEAGPGARRAARYATLAGLLEGAALLVVSAAIVTYRPGMENIPYLVAFSVTAIGYLYAKHRALTESSALIEGIIRDIRLKTADRIRHAGFRAVERIDPARLSSVLSKEARRLAEATGNIVTAWTSLVMLVAGFVIILFLSAFAFQLTAIFVIAGVGIYVINARALHARMTEAVMTELELQKKLSHLLEGFKELRLNFRKMIDLVENHYGRLASEARRLFEAVWNGFALNQARTSALLLTALGSVVFLMPPESLLGNIRVFQILTVTIFMLGHMVSLLLAAPQLAKARVAIEQIRSVERDLAALESEKARLGSEGLAAMTEFQEILIEALAYRYTEAGRESGFKLGPMTLSIRSGEVVFLAGGNGSGKSTFVRLLTGLYPPDSGRIVVDENEVTSDRLPAYRALFSPVFTDYHLFDRLYGASAPTRRESEEILRKLGLHQKISFDNRRFSTTDLSSGQQRRLALAVALFENKPICLFDEVAADQDPEFRKFLYRELFVELKRNGRTVVAVTHDDRYFDQADRVVTLKDGKIEEIRVRAEGSFPR